MREETRHPALNQETKRFLIGATVGAIVVACLTVLFIVIVVHMTGNDRAKITRDRDTRVACIAHGGTLVDGATCFRTR